MPVGWEVAPTHGRQRGSAADLAKALPTGEPTPISVFDLVGKGITATAAIGPRITRRPGGLRGFEEQALTALVEKRLTPLLTRFPLSEAADAHEALESRRTTGKVVLIP